MNPVIGAQHSKDLDSHWRAPLLISGTADWRFKAITKYLVSPPLITEKPSNSSFPYDVRCLVWPGTNQKRNILESRNLRVFIRDVKNKHELLDFFADAKGAIHLHIITPPSYDNPTFWYKGNLSAIETLHILGRENGVKRFFILAHASTIKTITQLNGLHGLELTPTPQSGEETDVPPLMHKPENRIPVIICPEFLVPEAPWIQYLIQRIMAGRPILVPNPVSKTLCLTYTDDFCTWLLHNLIQQGENASLFNPPIMSTTISTLIDVIHTALQVETKQTLLKPRYIKILSPILHPLFAQKIIQRLGIRNPALDWILTATAYGTVQSSQINTTKLSDAIHSIVKTYLRATSET